MGNYKEYKELRDQGLTFQQIGDKYGISRQSVENTLRNHKGGGKIQRALRNISINEPIFIPKASSAGVVTRAKKEGYKVITRQMVQDDVEGIWVCRIE